MDRRFAKKYYPFYEKDTDIVFNEYAKIICDSCYNYLDEVDNLLDRFLEKNGNNEDLLVLKNWEIKRKMYYITSDLRVDLRNLIEAIRHSTRSEYEKEIKKKLKKKLKKQNLILQFSFLEILEGIREKPE